MHDAQHLADGFGAAGEQEAQGIAQQPGHSHRSSIVHMQKNCPATKDLFVQVKVKVKF